MSFFEVLCLSLIQGFTEFIPISSSAHLILTSYLLGISEDYGLFFDIALHGGTLFAVLIYFRKDLKEILASFPARCSLKKPFFARDLSYFIILATIPALIFGFFLKDLIEEFLRSPFIIALSTLGFAFLLLLADLRAKKNLKLEDMSTKKALFIGFMQALALIPGVSRSGITITAGLFSGFKAADNARFSFLLSIPLISVILLYQLFKIIKAPEAFDTGAIFIGMFISFLSGLICIHFFLKIITKLGFMPFIVYRILLGSFLLYYFFP